jgi:hypothetical protein
MWEGSGSAFVRRRRNSKYVRPFGRAKSNNNPHAEMRFANPAVTTARDKRRWESSRSGRDHCTTVYGQLKGSVTDSGACSLCRYPPNAMRTRFG